MTGNGEIFMQPIRDARAPDNLGVLVTASYFEPQMSRAEANQADWPTFRERMKPLHVGQLGTTNVEYAVTPKANPWGAEDANIFVGEGDREIFEIDDLTGEEGQAFLDLNFSLAQGLLDADHCTSAQVTIGFNRQDLSKGHHSVLKLHSHIRVMSSELDLARREYRSWNSFPRFSQFAFIEPFASLYHDYISHAVAKGAFMQSVVGDAAAGPGYSSLLLKKSADLSAVFEDTAAVYGEMRAEYNNIAAIFTSGSADPHTERYIPRPKEERRARLEEFMQARSFYSDRSVRCLRYLAEHIRPADKRPADNPAAMSTPGMLYLTRGFAGCLNWAFRKNSDLVKFDFVPRAVTTDSIAKTMMGDNMPTLLVRTDDAATAREHKTMQAYHDKLASMLQAGLKQPKE